MRSITLGLILALTLPASAAYVQSGKQNFAGSRSSTVCSPNSGSGSVTAGHTIVMFALLNSATSITISSTRVSSWTQDDHQTSSPSNFYMFHGMADTSGAETITVALTAGTTFAGSACWESSNPTFNQKGTGSVTTTLPITDIVACGFNASGGSYTMSSPYTTRQTVDDGAGNNYLVLGDQSVTSTGSYSFNTTPVSTMSLTEAFAASASPPGDVEVF